MQRSISVMVWGSIFLTGGHQFACGLSGNNVSARQSLEDTLSFTGEEGPESILQDEV